MLVSNRLSIVPVLLTSMAFAPVAWGQVVYSENFRSPTMPGTDGVTPCNTGSGGAGTYAFPVDWLLRNVDNRTPNAQVSYVNDAWEVREDFAADVNNCVAFSTSWYSPAGAANDFMWSPTISVPAAGAALSWRAKSYDAAYQDGYEVRIMAAPNAPTGGTGTIGNQLTNSTVVFSTAAEASTWTPHTVDLAAYSGQTIQVGFRNNSNDKFILVVDDMSVTGTQPDLAAQAPLPILPYTQVPVGLGYVPTLGVRGNNLGGSTLTNVTASAQLVKDTANIGGPVASTTVASIAVGASAPIPFSNTAEALSALGEWTVRYTVAAAQSEVPGVQANNSIVSAATTVTASELARHEAAPSGTLGIGAGNGGELGVQFTVPTTVSVTAVRFGLAEKSSTVEETPGGPTRPSDWAGIAITANLRAFDTANNRPGALIATTSPGTTAFAATSYTLQFSTGPQTLAPGTYVVTVNEPIPPVHPEDGTLPLMMHDARFQTGTTWVNWPTAPTGNWANFESFGANFGKTPQITLITSLPDLLKDGFENPPPARAAAASPADPRTTRQVGLKKLTFAKPGG